MFTIGKVCQQSENSTGFRLECKTPYLTSSNPFSARTKVHRRFTFESDLFLAPVYKRLLLRSLSAPDLIESHTDYSSLQESASILNREPNDTDFGKGLNLRIDDASSGALSSPSDDFDLTPKNIVNFWMLQYGSASGSLRLFLQSELSPLYIAPAFLHEDLAPFRALNRILASNQINPDTVSGDEGKRTLHLTAVGVGIEHGATLVRLRCNPYTPTDRTSHNIDGEDCYSSAVFLALKLGHTDFVFKVVDVCLTKHVTPPDEVGHDETLKLSSDCRDATTEVAGLASLVIIAPDLPARLLYVPRPCTSPTTEAGIPFI